MTDPTTLDLLPSPLDLLQRWQPDLFRPEADEGRNEPPPISAENLVEAVTLHHVDVLSRMTPERRQALRRSSFLGAVLYYLTSEDDPEDWVELRHAYWRYLRIEAAKERLASAPPLPSLDTGAINVDLTGRDSGPQRWRFRNCMEEREAWLRVLPLCEPDPSSVMRTLRCGRGAVVKRNRESGAFQVEALTCGKRTCPVCALRHRLRTRDRLREALSGPWKRNDWRFVTLTLRADGKPLRDRITRLSKAFRRLRQQKAWSTTQTDGVGVVEVKWNEKGDNWHVHFHVLTRGSYIDQRVLSAAWHQATGDSTIVDIRQVKSREKAINYLCKYVGKSPIEAGGKLPDERLGDWYVGIKRKRLLVGFGGLKKLPDVPDGDQEKRLDSPWEWFATLGELLQARSQGDSRAEMVLKILEREDRKHVRDGPTHHASNDASPSWFD